MRAEKYHFRGLQSTPGLCMYCGSATHRYPNRGAMNICRGCFALRERAKRAAHRAVKLAVAAGDLPKIESQFCNDCGAFATLYEHRSYHRPLDVDPICHCCNQRRGPGFWDPALHAHKAAA